MKTTVSKIALVTFVAIGIGMSVYVAAKAIIKGKVYTVLERKAKPPMLIPRPYLDYRLERAKMLMTKIESEKRWLDSLANHDSLKFHEILKASPNIIQNIHSLDSLFIQLLKR